MLLRAGSLVDVDDADRELLNEVLRVAHELLALFKRYEPLLTKLRQPSSIWKK